MSASPDPIVLMTLRDLPADCQPVHIYRADGFTMVAVDPSFSMFDVSLYCVDNLTPGEQNAFRDAMNEPRVGTGCVDPYLISEDAHMTWDRIPSSLLSPAGKLAKAEVIAARLAEPA